MQAPDALVAVLREPTRVLVIEDETRYREFLVDALGDMHCAPAGVGSAIDAMSALEERVFDVLLLDLNMPVMGGLEYLERFRRRDARTPVIILTGVGDLPSAQEAIRFGVTEFLTKPCPLGRIEAAIDRARRQLASQRDAPAAQGGGSSVPAPATTIADLERIAILDSIERHGGNRSAAAKELGISRRTLYNKLELYQRAERDALGSGCESD